MFLIIFTLTYNVKHKGILVDGNRRIHG